MARLRAATTLTQSKSACAARQSSSDNCGRGSSSSGSSWPTGSTQRRPWPQRVACSSVEAQPRCSRHPCWRAARTCTDKAWTRIHRCITRGTATQVGLRAGQNCARSLRVLLLLLLLPRAGADVLPENRCAMMPLLLTDPKPVQGYHCHHHCHYSDHVQSHSRS